MTTNTRVILIVFLGPCDFSKGTCGYTSSHSNYEFARAQPGGQNAPSIDHTTNSKTGLEIYI